MSKAFSCYFLIVFPPSVYPCQSNFFDFLGFCRAALMPKVCVGPGLPRGAVKGVGLERPDTLGKVADMSVAAVGAELGEGRVEVVQIFLVEAAGPAAGDNVLGELVGVLGADKLLIVRGADVDEGRDGRGVVGWVEGGVVDGVAVDLADVEIVLDLGDAVRDDAIGNTPDLLGGRVVVVDQGVPVRRLDESDDAARSFWSASVVLAKGHACGHVDGPLTSVTVRAAEYAQTGEEAARTWPR